MLVTKWFWTLASERGFYKKAAALCRRLPELKWLWSSRCICVIQCIDVTATAHPAQLSLFMACYLLCNSPRSKCSFGWCWTSAILTRGGLYNCLCSLIIGTKRDITLKGPRDIGLPWLTHFSIQTLSFYDFLQVSYFSLRNLTRALRFALRLARRSHGSQPDLLDPVNMGCNLIMSDNVW